MNDAGSGFIRVGTLDELRDRRRMVIGTPGGAVLVVADGDDVVALDNERTARHGRFASFQEQEGNQGTYRQGHGAGLKGRRSGHSRLCCTRMPRSGASNRANW